MSDTGAERASDGVVPDDCRAGKERHPANLPVVAPWLKRSRIVRFLLSRSPAFRIMMFGSSISMFGSRISTIAFPMLVLHLYNSPFNTGLAACAAIAPSMLIYVPAGVLVDRWNPRRVMLYSELLRGITIASVVISLAIFWNHTGIWFLIIAMVFEEIFETFSILADRRYLRGLTELVNYGLAEQDNIASKQASIEVRAHAVVLAGRPIGPFLFAIQPLFPFLADAVSFFFSVGSLIVVRRSDEPVRQSQRLSLRQLAGGSRQGFKWLLNDRRARVTVILMAVTSLVAQALILMLLAQAHSKHLSTLAIGIVLGASGAGGAVGSISFKFLPRTLAGFWLPIQMVAWSVAIAFLWLVDGLPVGWSAAAMFMFGLTGAIGNIDFGTYIATKVAEDMIARVTAIGQVLSIGACALGPVLGGYAIQHYGVRTAVQFLLILVVALAICSLIVSELSENIVPTIRLVVEIMLVRKNKRQQLAAGDNLVGVGNAAAGEREENPFDEGIVYSDDQAVVVLLKTVEYGQPWYTVH